jgi:hypothetical protein
MKIDSAFIDMFKNIWPHLGERERRLLAAAEAQRIGYGGISLVSKSCGLSRVTITKGIKELQEAPLKQGRERRSGAGRATVEHLDPEIENSLDNLVMASTRGDPESPLLWTCKSTRTLAQELTNEEHKISHVKVAQLLHRNQGNRRRNEIITYLSFEISWRMELHHSTFTKSKVVKLIYLQALRACK